MNSQPSVEQEDQACQILKVFDVCLLSIVISDDDAQNCSILARFFFQSVTVVSPTPNSATSFVVLSPIYKHLETSNLSLSIMPPFVCRAGNHKNTLH